MCKTFSILLLLISLPVSSSHADDQAKAKSILDQAIEAHGGEAVLGKFVAMRCKFKGTGYDGDKKVPLTYVWFYQGSDKMRSLFYDEGATTASIIEVVNGIKGWGKENDQPTEEMDSDELQSCLDTIAVSWATSLAPLRGAGYRLSTLEEITLDGRKAVGILAAHDKHAPLKLYFDKESHLLVKYERKLRYPKAKRNQTEETRYSDYHDVQGTKQPRKMITFWNGVKASDMKLEEIELYEKPLDDKLFAKP
jgi:hypothetical protein